VSDLTKFRDHCRRMADATHKPECPSITARAPYWQAWDLIVDDAGYVSSLAWRGPKPHWEPPRCDGCMRDIDRALFCLMADEIDAYLQAGVGEELVDLFDLEEQR